MKKKLFSLLITALILSALLPAALASGITPIAQGMPAQIYTSSDVDCYMGDQVLVSAVAGDGGGYYQYQWFMNSSNSSTNGILIPGATSAEYSPDTSAPGTYYYYCAVMDASGAANYSQPIRVGVQELAVSGIYVVSMPYKTTFIEGDYMDAAGLSIAVRMSNGSERIVNAGYQISPTQFVQTGPQNVTVVYGGMSCTFPVVVQSMEQSITGIGIVSLPTKTQYNSGDYLDTSGLVFRVYTQDGYKDMNSDFTCEPMILSGSGSQTVTLIYKNKTCTFNVTVSGGAKLLEVTSTPRKLSYKPGESLDTAGLVLRMSDGVNSQIISSGFSCEPTVFTSEGTQVVKVRYNDLLATFTVKVSSGSSAAGTGGSTAAKPVATAAPTATAAPGSSTDTPSPSPSATPRPLRIDHDDYEPSSKRSTLVVVMILCIIALIVLGTLMVLINTGKLDQLKAMFQKSSPRRDDRYRGDYYEVSEWDEYRRDYEQRRRDEFRRDRDR